MRRFVPWLSFVLPLTLVACSGDAGDAAPAASAPEVDSSKVEPGDTPAEDRPIVEKPAAKPPPAPAPNRFDPGGAISDAQLAEHHVALTCSVDGKEVGTLTLELWSERAPITVRNFLRLCDTGFYDGVKFHRILRDFMVQGGDPTGTGMGDSPYGTIQAEFSDDPARAHGYGVISMARSDDPNSASCQFFLCCNEGPKVWGLDGQYASFGRLTSGVAVLEALANAPVESNGRELAAPTVPVAIVRAEVRAGPAPRGETIARPAPDLGDEPPVLVFQHVLVSFQGAPRSPATRSRADAEQLVVEIAEKARAGEDFNALVVAHTDAVSAPGDETPGVYKVRNHGVSDLVAERAAFDVLRKAQADLSALAERVQKGELDQAAAQAQQQEIFAVVNAARDRAGAARADLPKAVADLVFTLDVGEVGILAHDPNTSPMGWHVIKRFE